MATKRQKKEEAKRRIAESVPTLPIPRFVPGPLRAATLILKGAEVGGQALVELDPLGIITDDPVIMPARDLTRVVQGPQLSPGFVRTKPAEQMMMAMVNDPEFVLDKDTVDLINNQERMLIDTGAGMAEVNGRDVIRRSGQFRRDALLPRSSTKRSRKKTKTDKNMSKALAQANQELRKQNGQLRLGVTQSQIMTRAHRIRRKLERESR
jgi:hypothetical protein